MPNCVQDGTHFRPNGAAETLRTTKGRKTHAFLYVDEYFHRIALSRSFPMRIFTVNNLVCYAQLYTIRTLPTIAAGSRGCRLSINTGSYFLSPWNSVKAICSLTPESSSLSLLSSLRQRFEREDFLPSTHASRNGQAMWDTIPLGTSYGLPCVLIYVFTDGRLPATAFGIPLSYGRRANCHIETTPAISQNANLSHRGGTG